MEVAFDKCERPKEPESKTIAMEFHNTNFEDLGHLLKNRSLSFDVKIKVGKEGFKKVFKAHSTILSTRSVCFQNALSNQTKESGFFIFKMPDIQPAAFKVILK